MKIGRNDPCPCGSGKKYKKCHLNKTIPSFQRIEPTPELTRLRDEVEMQNAERRSRLERMGIFIDFVRPIIFKGGKVWVLENTVYHSRPIKQTFHEFIISILYETIGEEWRQSQLGLSERERHFIYRCSEKFYQWQAKQTKPENMVDTNIWAARPDGWTRALLSLAFDICSLKHAAHIPKNLLDRLKNKDQYQGARYEIAIAAIFARLGYEIQFLDEEKRPGPRCEFIANNIKSGEKIAVEVKSKIREGVLHTKGQSDAKQLLWGDIQRLYRHALKQNPRDRPFLIFIDLNSPQTPHLDWHDKPWIKDIQKMIKKAPLHDPNNPDPCSVIVFTNYSYHYQTENEALPGEHMLTIPLYPVFPIKDPNFFNKLGLALKEYGNVPNLDVEIGQ